jgi:hypothetical protein
MMAFTKAIGVFAGGEGTDALLATLAGGCLTRRGWIVMHQSIGKFGVICNLRDTRTDAYGSMLRPSQWRTCVV